MCGRPSLHDSGFGTFWNLLTREAYGNLLVENSTQESGEDGFSDQNWYKT